MSEIKTISFKLAGGVNQDNDPQSQGSDTPYRLFNIKTQQLNNSTSYALINEKGNTQVPLLIPTNKDFNYTYNSSQYSYWIKYILLDKDNTETSATYFPELWVGNYAKGSDENVTLQGWMHAGGNWYKCDIANLKQTSEWKPCHLKDVVWVETPVAAYNTFGMYLCKLTTSNEATCAEILDQFTVDTLIYTDTGYVDLSEVDTLDKLKEQLQCDGIGHTDAKTTTLTEGSFIQTAISTIWVKYKYDTASSTYKQYDYTVLKAGYNTFYLAETEVVGAVSTNVEEAVIFTSNKQDLATEGTCKNYILKLTLESSEDLTYIAVTPLFIGDLQISTSYQIIGIFLYENSSLQKLYWTDGHNQLRMLNISDQVPMYKNGKNGIYWYTEANFVASNPDFSQKHSILVTKREGGGYFQAGIIQWAFTYYNKYGAETNLVDITPLYYICPEYRGAKADDVISCSFKLTFYNLDTSFEYLRLYSIQRSSLNGTPTVQVVGNYKLSNQ